MAEGREGDWDCGECRNRNYAFRSICNRCKQPRLLVDTKTPADSKWLPRIGDWICAGCSNNNYASREKCKKCGQSKEEAAMPAIPVSMACIQSYTNFLGRVQGLHGSMVTSVPNVNPSFESLPYNSNFPYLEFEKYKLHPAFSQPLNENSRYLGNIPLTSGPNGWRSGDWMCNCGFHNYSSRTECKKCNAPLTSVGPSAASSRISDMFPTLGTKRLASEEFAADWDNKRLNSGDAGFLDFEQQARLGSIYTPGLARYPSGNLVSTSMTMASQSLQNRSVLTILGKGANQWRDGDWMCNNCNNHNYASRSFCNRCKTQKEAASLPVSVL